MSFYQEFNHQDNLGFCRFDLSTVNDSVVIKYNSLTNGSRNKVLPNDKMHIIQMNVKNIPDIVSALNRIFQTPEGGSWSLQENGDKVEIDMLFDNRGMSSSLILWDESRRIETDLSNKVEFIFEEPIYYNSPLPRIPTPSMVWFSDTLKQIHDDWKKQKDGGASV